MEARRQGSTALPVPAGGHWQWSSVAPHVGGQRAVEAAPEPMVALGLSLPEPAELADTRCHHSPPPGRPPAPAWHQDRRPHTVHSSTPARRGLTATPGALPARTPAKTTPGRRPAPRPGPRRALARGAVPASPRGTSAPPEPLADVIGAAESKLREDRVDVLFNGVSGQEERLCNRRVALTLSNLGQHLALAWRQISERRSPPPQERAKTSTSTIFGSKATIPPRPPTESPTPGLILGRPAAPQQ